LVVKDGLILSDRYTTLIKKISWIVSKARKSTSIAEELRKLNKFVNKCVVTRWNSILFMIRSVLRITPEEWAEVRGKMSRTSYKDEKKYNKFFISSVERSMLQELETVLSMFELITDEFQSNRVSISRVYPCVDSLKDQLEQGIDQAIYTNELRGNFLLSLEKRFGGMFD